MAFKTRKSARGSEKHVLRICSYRPPCGQVQCNVFLSLKQRDTIGF